MVINELERQWKYLWPNLTLFQYKTGGTDQHHENLSQDNRLHGSSFETAVARIRDKSLNHLSVSFTLVTSIFEFTLMVTKTGGSAILPFVRNYVIMDKDRISYCLVNNRFVPGPAVTITRH
jgi:hypothetical protein